MLIQKTYQQAFTIVELLVVIIVIGILASISIVSYAGISDMAIAATLKSDLKNASNQLEIDYTTNDDQYPLTEAAANDGRGLPKSPETIYQYTSDGDSYSLSATSSRSETVAFSIVSTDKTIKDGVALGHTLPGGGGGGELSFANSWGGASDDYGHGIIQMADGGYIVAGEAYSFGAGSSDIFLAKYNSSGALSWNKTFGSTGSEYISDLSLASDGGFVAAGYTTSYGSNGDGFAAKFTASGTLTWFKSWGGSGVDDANTVYGTSDGGCIIAGNAGSFGTSGGMYVAKFASDGTLSWNKVWDGTSGGIVRSIIQISDGSYILAGQTASSSAGSYDAITMKITSDGTLSWSKMWGGTGWDAANSIIQTSDDGYIITGETKSFGAGNNDAFIVKYSSSGTLSWSKTWGGSGWDNSIDIISTSDGGFAITGETGSYDGTAMGDAYIAKFTSDGTLSWSKTFGNADDWDYSNSLLQTSDGGYALTGYADSFGTGGDAFIAKFKSDGSMDNCVSPLCQSPSATITTPSPTTNTPSLTTSTPSANVNIQTPTEGDPSATDAVIVAL